MSNVAVIDYGRGNIHSIVKALNTVGAKVTVYTDDSFLEEDLVILPGVGAFSEGMKGLKERGQDTALKKFAGMGKPILGICLGCQLLLSQSEEFGVTQGLNLISGRVVAIPESKESIPHVGWKKIRMRKNISFLSSDYSAWGYFVHSYCCMLNDDENLLATVEHGLNEVAAIIGSKNIYGFQFHPEKSGPGGLVLLKKFLGLIDKQRELD